MGAGPNRLVAVVMEKGWEQVVAVLAILEAGAAYLPVDPDLPQERRWLLLQRGEVEIVLTQPVSAGPAGMAGGRAMPVGRMGRWRSRTKTTMCRPQPVRDSEDLAYVIFTSGSTGEPKGVMVEHRSALNTVLDINDRFAVSGAMTASWRCRR